MRFNKQKMLYSVITLKNEDIRLKLNYHNHHRINRLVVFLENLKKQVIYP